MLLFSAFRNQKNVYGAPEWLSRLRSAFGLGHDPRVLRLSPTSGSLLSGLPASPSPSAVPPACTLFLSQINE